MAQMEKAGNANALPAPALPAGRFLNEMRRCLTSNGGASNDDASSAGGGDASPSSACDATPNAGDASPNGGDASPSDGRDPSALLQA